MSTLTFEGDYEDLTIKQIQFIRDVIEERGFSDKKVVFAPAAAVGDNYASKVVRITVDLEDGDNFSMIAKIATSIESARTMQQTRVLFNNEIVMYTEILPKFVKLQRAAGVSEEDVLKYVECYGCLAEEPDEVILLEDLKPRDFIMLDRMTPISHEAVKMILKNFAIIHSLSFALRKLEPEFYDTLKDKLVDLWGLVVDMPENAVMMKQLETGIIDILHDEFYKNAIKTIFSNTMEINRKVLKSDPTSKHSVIIQGDSWTNNIMFKLEGEVLKRCIMIDYQLSRVANPACDLLYMLFNCTDHTTRAEHFLEWLNYYHEELDKSLSNFGIKANNVYSKDKLETDIRGYSKIYFTTASMVLSIALRTSDEAAGVQDAMKEQMENMTEAMSVKTLTSETTSLFKARIMGLIDTCQKFGLLTFL